MLMNGISFEAASPMQIPSSSHKHFFQRYLSITLQDHDFLARCLLEAIQVRVLEN